MVHGDYDEKSGNHRKPYTNGHGDDLSKEQLVADGIRYRREMARNPKIKKIRVDDKDEDLVHLDRSSPMIGGWSSPIPVTPEQHQQKGQGDTNNNGNKKQDFARMQYENEMDWYYDDGEYGDEGL